MNKLTLRLIISLMTIALLGLISFQLYWINNAIKINQSEFEQDVNEALRNVVKKLEKQEVLYITSNKLHSLHPGRRPFKTDTFFVPPAPPVPDLNSIDSILTHIEIPEININFDEIIEQNIKLKKSIHKAPAKDGSANDIERLVKKESIEYERINDQVRQQLKKLSHKSDMLSTVLNELINPEKAIENRINTKDLDSLLHEELRNNGIEITYSYGIYDKKSRHFIYLKDSAEQEKLLRSGMMVNLFPNDLFGNLNYLAVHFPHQQKYLIKKIWLTLASSGVLVLVIVFCFSYAIYTIIRQKKLSEIKNDFINNMTHEFKTPIATVSLACEALQDSTMQKDENFVHRYVDIISDENKRLGQQVEKVLQIATLEKKDYKLKWDKVNLHEIIEKALFHVNLAVEKRGGKISTSLKAINPELISDKVHLTNIIYNLLDNANKYSPEAPEITIKTENNDQGIKINISDKGMGMTKESINKIFEKFYRVPTGNVHDVKGFGLGLAYVKTMTEALGGNIHVVSTVKKGSTFTINFPFTNEKI